MTKQVIIVGGVAGGMSCAARIKRLDKDAAVTVFERGGAVSFANCGMPYYVGGVIQARENMIVQTAERLHNRYGLDIFTRHEATRILPGEKAVEVRNLETGVVFRKSYDALVLAPGATPYRPPIPGIDGPNVHTLNSLDDMDGLRHAAVHARRACVVGAGFIGVELTENLRRLGLETTLVEAMDQMLPHMDAEMTAPLLQELQLNGVKVRLGASVGAIDETGVTLADGEHIPADLVCLCTGVRPRSELARDAGLELGPQGHIVVNSAMQTSDPDIYAVGDAVQTQDLVAGRPAAVPLAGPANRQGRIAADVICGRNSAYAGVQGTSIVRLFAQTAAATGVSEKRLRADEIPYFRVFVHPAQHAKYYPGATPVSIKGLFSPEGRLLGAQVVGIEGVESVINVLATAVRAGMIAADLEQLELAYAPQYGSAKSGINMLGFAAANIMKGDVATIEADNTSEEVFWLDVREHEEAECGAIPGATVIPLDRLRSRLAELPRDRTIAVYCAAGLRGYIACRLLTQSGYKAANLNGGYRTWAWVNARRTGPHTVTPLIGVQCGLRPRTQADTPGHASVSARQLDVRGLQCPGPIAKVKAEMAHMAPGDVLEVISTDPGFIADIPAWCGSTGNTLLEAKPEGGAYRARIACGPAADTSGSPVPATAQAASKDKTIICFSDDLDRVMAAFVIANGAAAMNGKVTLFFTFWGLNVLKKEQAPPLNKGLLDRMFGMMMPKGPARLKLSRMHMGGLGSAMMRHVMKTKRVMSLEELLQSARDAGVRLVACSMSMDVMGIAREELIDGIDIGGVGAYLGAAEQSGVNLFI